MKNVASEIEAAEKSRLEATNYLEEQRESIKRSAYRSTRLLKMRKNKANSREEIITAARTEAERM